MTLRHKTSHTDRTETHFELIFFLIDCKILKVLVGILIIIQVII